ncbi:hypothetical protein ACVDG8_002395 [Mesorhizobium sp. ORM8.1]
MKTNLERHFDEIARKALLRENERAERWQRESEADSELRRRVSVSAYRSPFQDVVDAYREAERNNEPSMFERVLALFGWRPI